MLFEGSSLSRCSSLNNNNMKQPRLPGAEKFKFSNSGISQSNSSAPINNMKTIGNNAENGFYPGTFHHAKSTRYSQSELNPLMCTLSVPSLNRNDSRRRAVLPITCKKTSRMLNNTNLELNVDHADIVSESDIKNGRLSTDSSRVPSCPNLESSRSLNASKTSLDAYFRKLSLQNPPIRENPNVDWMNIRATPSRLSASCSSSCSSEENVWVLREDSERY